MNTRSGFVLSDLHLFAGRSDGHSLFDSVRPKIEAADVLVLNGDTFDFRWSQFDTEEESVTEAIAWLAELVDGMSQDQQIYFLQGNHDCHLGFIEALGDLSKSEERIIVEERHLVLGRNLFLHGDPANWKMDQASLSKFREQWRRDRSRGKVAARIYEAVDALGISKAFHHVYFPTEKTIQRIEFHLDDAFPNWREEIDAVYFGHTHCPFEDFDKDGVRFFNTGSGLRGMGFVPQAFEFEME